jgi:long-subunit acyl-CoA synthetase (AMP-forming)
MNSNNLKCVGKISNIFQFKLKNGYLALKSDSVFSGYLNINNDSYFDDGYFITNDLVTIDKNGYLYVDGRTKVNKN